MTPNTQHEHQHGHEADAHCEHHGSNPPLCVCDHNPGGECHCPPNAVSYTHLTLPTNREV